MAAAIGNYSFKDGHGCPICLDEFISPRQLPCLHSFCEHCLQDYITKKAKCSEKTLEEFVCPICRAVTRPANKQQPVGEWAALFPYSSFPLLGKSKVERFCEVCLNALDRSSNLAEKLCVVCEEFMCNNCAVYHRNMKISKSHQIISIEDWESNPETRTRLREGFGCPEHDNEDIKFYCRSHNTACCGTCFFLQHKTCHDMLDLKQNLSGLLKEMNAHKIMEQMRKLENHLNDYIQRNEENISINESHVNKLSEKIRDIRRKLNFVLDDIEKMVKLEANRTYKEWLTRKQEQNHQCQSLVSAIRNSQSLLETVDQFGSDTQKLLVTSKTIKQLQCYSDQIREKFERVDNIKMKLELDSSMKAVLSKGAEGLVRIVCQEEATDLQCTSHMIPLQQQNIELSRVIDIHCSSDNFPCFFHIVHLRDGCIVLADNNSETCYLYDLLYNFVTSHNLPENPKGMCLIEDNEVAIAMPNQRTIQFLSIRDRSIRETGTVITKYQCFGLAAVTRNEILVSGRCFDTWSKNKCYWSIITRNGNVKFHHEFDSHYTSYVYAALDMPKSRVYISVCGSNAVYCFGLTDGKQYFVYLSNDLKYPMGVAVDRDDNIYVVGRNSNNIHKLSSDGFTLQVITAGVPQQPRGISFNSTMDHFVITNGSQMRKLHCFVHK